MESAFTLETRHAAAIVTIEAAAAEHADPGTIAASIAAAMQAANARHAVLDLSQLSMLNSPLLNVVLDLRRKLDASGGTVVLTGISREMKVVLEVTRLDHVFQLFDSINAAAEHLQTA
jgi:anti-anti-sigma factor